MSTPMRLAAFAGALVVVFALAFGVGRAVPTIGDDTPEHPHEQISEQPGEQSGPEVNHEH